MRRLLVAAVMATSLTGCFHVRYTNDGPAAAEPAEKGCHHNVVFGLVQVSQPENASKACPDGLALVKSEQSFVAGLVNVLTFSLYSPTDFSITCKAKK